VVAVAPSVLPLGVARERERHDLAAPQRRLDRHRHHHHVAQHVVRPLGHDEHVRGARQRDGEDREELRAPHEVHDEVVDARRGARGEPLEPAQHDPAHDVQRGDDAGEHRDGHEPAAERVAEELPAERVGIAHPVKLFAPRHGGTGRGTFSQPAPMPPRPRWSSCPRAAHRRRPHRSVPLA
jgi:hypothetical protein